MIRVLAAAGRSIKSVAGDKGNIEIISGVEK
jgi:hypothetical protein